MDDVAGEEEWIISQRALNSFNIHSATMYCTATMCQALFQFLGISDKEQNRQRSLCSPAGYMPVDVVLRS